MIEHKDILSAISARKTWEERQTVWEQMRHDGLRRTQKPFPGAADMHFPLADTTIEKLKPFYVEQLFSSEVIAQFTGRDSASVQYQTTAAQWFDDQLKQRSNFEHTLVIAVDKTLQHGKNVVKVWWDTEEKALRFESIPPLNLIVPTHTTTIDKADWIVHVQQYSKAAYKRLKAYGFDTAEATIEQIAKTEPSNEQHEQTRFERQGLTYSSTKDQIVVWELWEREEDGSWCIRYYSPTCPTKDLRPKSKIPYNKGIFEKSAPPPPFFELSAELKDVAFYDSRSICERAAPFEQSLNKDWNTSKDYQTLTTSPCYHAPGGIPGNTGNIQMIPGQIIPFEIQPILHPSTPVDIAQSMISTRMVFEQSIAMPDFGSGQQNGGGPRKTATEISTIASVMGQNTNLRARIFKRELAVGLRIAWALLIQYAAEELQYEYLGELKELDKNAINGKYRIEPSGSGDSFSKERSLQEAQAIYSLFKGDPEINQINLKKFLLEKKDARLIKQLILDQGTQAADQIEDQAQELTMMMIGFPAQVKPTDDDSAHISSILGFLNKPNNPVMPSPEATLLIAKHIAEHVAQWKKAKPDQFKAAAPQLQPQLQAVQVLAQQAQQAMQMMQAPQAQPMAMTN